MDKKRLQQLAGVKVDKLLESRYIEKMYNDGMKAVAEGLVAMVFDDLENQTDDPITNDDVADLFDEYAQTTLDDIKEFARPMIVKRLKEQQ